MKKILVLSAGIVFCFLMNPVSGYCTEYDWKEELQSDREAIREQKEEIKDHAEAARAEERQLREEIQQAVTAGDKAKADELRAKLKSTHHENVDQKRADKKELHDAKKEYKKDRHETHRDGRKPGHKN